MSSLDLVMWQNAERYFQNGIAALKREEYDVAVREFQLASEHALKFFAKACGISLKIHETHTILLMIENTEMKKLNSLLQHLDPKRRNKFWKDLKSLANSIDFWKKKGVYNNGTSFEWGPCKIHQELTYGDDLHPSRSLEEAITRKDAEEFYQKVIRIFNLVREATFNVRKNSN